jgi:hypothetical protein
VESRIAHVVKRRVAQRIPQVHQRPRFEQRIHTLRAAVNRSDVQRRPSRSGIDPVDDPAHDGVVPLILAARRIGRQTIREPRGVIRSRREMD